MKLQLQKTADRIPKRAFVISTSVFLGLSLVAVIARFLIRFRVQRQLPNIDDLFLTLATALLLVSAGFLYEEVIDLCLWTLQKIVRIGVDRSNGVGPLWRLLECVNDLLVIPIAVTWTVRVPWKQKIILICSLCLTIIMASLSIIRVSGFVYYGMSDVIWGLYWQFLAAEVGVFLAAAVAFRSFFVARKNSRNATPPYSIKRFVKESITGAYRPRGLHSLYSSSFRGSGVDLEDMANDNTDTTGSYDSLQGQESRAGVSHEQNLGTMPLDHSDSLHLCPSIVRTKDLAKVASGRVRDVYPPNACYLCTVR
ncbi:hypothetical protein N8T08_007666 [Aspergillus melleus]|uniref:Uncharacterized protein n=1 Tax=Aspergillus melleus TaxID=138277 RepID=A0ACC3BEF8_9EURO|nr:hypothetical protein N8T08_007666 [Aspergillus melleus]